MFLVDTNVISEARKRERADPGVIAFWQEAASNDIPIFLAAVTIGELRRGIELISHRGDRAQAALLEQWLQQVLDTSDITNLRHVRTTAETREAEEIANRERYKYFKRFRPLFDGVAHDLKMGVRK